ncbi:aminotransferase family protein [Moniliophthora roreri]|uniref:Aminotransferase class V domain-containing protein n=1 Tax=Moniliophthora roreri TaxID=221103 RepID=A0A0W0FBE4_MONRR|nr:aminotransferase family protein [Moniliophthora roreri]
MAAPRSLLRNSEIEKMASDLLQPHPFYKTKSPPPFGHAMLDYFAFSEDYTNMNHGSYGSCPIPVLDATKPIATLSEANPDLFHRLAYMPMLIEARKKAAKLIGVVDPDELVFVPNASHGVSTVLRNFIWEEGDILISTNTTYGAVSRAIHYLSDVPPHPSIELFTMLFPTSRTTILEDWKKHVKSIRAKNPNAKIVAVIDAIVSNPGVHLPWQEMIQICREENVYSLIDAAHAIGQEVGLDLGKADPDFWISNCHKWLFAKRSAAVLYVPKRNQHIIKTSFPTSHVYISPSKRNGKPDFVEQFEWNGTIDFVNYLSVHGALDFRAWLGGEEKINEYCHRLAVEGGKRLAEVMGTEVLDPTGEFTLCMTNVALPISPKVPPTPEVDLKFKTKMLMGKKIFGAHYIHNGRWWVRASAQIWLEVEDFEKLGKAYLDVCREIEQEVEAEEAEKIKSNL